MVVIESEMISQGEVESQLQSDQQHSRNNVFPSLGRQSSIYTLTLDEFQHTLCESGKNFGSMNMDEFLNSIWTAEENQAHAQAQAQGTTGTTTSTVMANNNNQPQFSMGLSTSAERSIIVRQPSLHKQGSLTLPGPLSRKTVDEVWSEIQKTQHEQEQSINASNMPNSGSTQRQPTYGEMTLEDFLVKAGVVREQGQPVPPIQQQPFGSYQNSNNCVGGPGHMARPIMGLGGGGSVSVPPYPPPQTIVGEPSGFVGIGKRGGRYQPPTSCYGSRVGNGGGVVAGYGQVQGLGIGSPVSPVSSDGMCGSQVDSGNQYGLDMGGIRGGRKRIIDGPVEKVVERRQRRMIKNRESAARSRARKQAYTVELEAELNQLKEENAQLKQALAELERKRNQQYFDEVKTRAPTKAQGAKEKLKIMRRNLSCPY